AALRLARCTWPKGCCRSSVVEHPLGKGGGVSLIPTGSTRNPRLPPFTQRAPGSDAISSQFLAELRLLGRSPHAHSKRTCGPSACSRALPRADNGVRSCFPRRRAR